LENPPKVVVIEITPELARSHKYSDTQDCPAYHAARNAGLSVMSVGGHYLRCGWIGPFYKFGQSFTISDVERIAQSNESFYMTLIPCRLEDLNAPTK